MKPASTSPMYTTAVMVLGDEVDRLKKEIKEIELLRAQREAEMVELIEENDELRRKTINGYSQRLVNW